MDLQLYECSLLCALALMIFFGIYFLVAGIPDKPIFVNYLRSRRIMGVALLVLSANTTFRDFIAQLRIRYAKRMLLEHPELTVNAISEMCGFLSPSNFTNVFKEKEGKSPARWRKEEGVESSVSS